MKPVIKFGRRVVLGCSYTLLTIAGILVVLYREAPHSVADQTSKPTEFVWATFCLIGGGLGLYGVIRNKMSYELLGLPLCSTASLSWAVAILLESKGAPNTIAAAAMAAAFAGFLASRFTEKMALLHFAAKEEGPPDVA